MTHPAYETTPELAGKIAIVTGAGGGIGSATSRKLASRGASVLLADLPGAGAGEVAAAIGSAAAACVLDVTDADQWEAALAHCEQLFGAPSVLVNNAGVAPMAPFEDTSDELFDTTMAVNVRGVFLGMRTVFPAMKAAGRGSIVNISSGNGFIASDETAAYVTSKFAVRGLTKNGAFEWARYGIRVNAVCPGMIRTPMMADDELAAIPDITPLGRIGEPDEIAEMVAYLASDRSSYSTGADFVVDGGILTGVHTKADPEAEEG